MPTVRGHIAQSAATPPVCTSVCDWQWQRRMAAWFPGASRHVEVDNLPPTPQSSRKAEGHLRSSISRPSVAVCVGIIHIFPGSVSTKVSSTAHQLICEGMKSAEAISNGP
eukprot:TRINITY_DN25368_c0_g1_i1.p1 TRINITY_DN25368_c0_g1~~TRINITY_DN25368_c0_g1_i1.p1  ORF type:complete len:110 (-),score=11.00 TRINITY_DN25368_c0_g1_i1:60-389(-)